MEAQRPPPPVFLTRRELIIRGAGVGFAVVALGGLAAAVDDGRDPCQPYPRQMEGPFYLADPPERADITEGLPGAPLALRVNILGGTACTPLVGALVDVWHTDALGIYSGYPGQGDSRDVDTRGKVFLRGMQRTNRDGDAAFQTIYPGWYRGRTTHIHFKVHLDQDTVITSQLYFPDDVTRGVYSKDPYAARGQKDTGNREDFIMDGAPVLDVRGDGTGGYVASMALRVTID